MAAPIRIPYSDLLKTPKSSRNWWHDQLIELLEEEEEERSVLRVFSWWGPSHHAVINRQEGDAIFRTPTKPSPPREDVSPCPPWTPSLSSCSNWSNDEQRRPFVTSNNSSLNPWYCERQQLLARWWVSLHTPFPNANTISIGTGGRKNSLRLSSSPFYLLKIIELPASLQTLPSFRCFLWRLNQSEQFSRSCGHHTCCPHSCWVVLLSYGRA